MELPPKGLENLQLSPGPNGNPTGVGLEDLRANAPKNQKDHTIYYSDIAILAFEL
jgi:hypothetical protein